MKYELSIVIPSYNEIKNIPILIDKYREEKGDVNFQLVIVDNGSSDGTAEYLKQKCSMNKFLKVVTVKRNIGYGYGINEGLKACDADIIGWSHGDLQCSPKDVFRAYEVFRSYGENDWSELLVKGHRINRNSMPQFIADVLRLLATLILFKRFDDINAQPKIFPRKLIDTFMRPPRGFSYDLYVQYKALKMGYQMEKFEVIFEDRKFGVSKSASSIIHKSVTIMSYVIDIFKIRVSVIK